MAKIKSTETSEQNAFQELKRSQQEVEFLTKEVDSLRDQIVENQMEMKTVAQDVLEKVNTLQSELLEAQQQKSKYEQEMVKFKGIKILQLF